MNDKWFVWRDGLWEGMVCAKGCNTENDKWFVWRDLIQRIIQGWFEQTIHTNQIITQTIYNSLYSFPSHKPSLHTNHFLFSVLHPFTQTIPSHQAPLHLNHLLFSVLHIVWFGWRDMVCVDCMCEGMSHNPSFHTNHPFTQTIYHSPYYILSGLCEGIVCVTSLHTNHPQKS